MTRIQYAFASSVGRSDSGHYTCSSTEHPNKTALVTVLGNLDSHCSFFSLLFFSYLIACTFVTSYI